MRTEGQGHNLRYRLHRTIVLVGMMGSGKTAIGRSLARTLNVEFLDSDTEIVAAAQRSIAEIFARDGEAFFRTREAEVILRLLNGVPGILSTGGGAYLSAQNRDAIARDGLAVWLDAPLDLLWERVRGKDTRPLLMTDDPFATLSHLFEERRPAYAHAQLRLSVSPGASIEETTMSLVSLLEDHPDILERVE